MGIWSLGLLLACKDCLALAKCCMCVSQIVLNMQIPVIIIIIIISVILMCRTNV